MRSMLMKNVMKSGEKEGVVGGSDARTARLLGLYRAVQNGLSSALPGEAERSARPVTTPPSEQLIAPGQGSASPFEAALRSNLSAGAVCVARPGQFKFVPRVPSAKASRAASLEEAVLNKLAETCRSRIGRCCGSGKGPGGRWSSAGVRHIRRAQWHWLRGTSMSHQRAHSRGDRSR